MLINVFCVENTSCLGPMTIMFLTDGSESADVTILLAHGAGAPMDSVSMTMIAQALSRPGSRIVRFEFSYMASRRTSSVRKPPPRAEKLVPEYFAAIDALDSKGPLVIGGKSMGGRVASMIADKLHSAGRICGLLCIGYPFHPPGKPGTLRTAHLAHMRTPTLIVQGTRDQFGTKEEVSACSLSSQIDVLWLEDGDHDLKSRKRVSGYSVADHLRTMGEGVSRWADKVSDAACQ